MILSKLFAWFILVYFGLASDVVMAADANSNAAKDALDIYYEVTNGFVVDAQKAGGILLFALLGLQITINGVKKLIRPAEIESMVSAVVWPLISTGFFIALIQLSDIFLPRVVNGFESLGMLAGGNKMKLAPGDFIFYGIDVALQMQDAFDASIKGGLLSLITNIFPAMFLLLIQVVVVVSFAIIGMQMALAMINAYFWYCVTPILLGFGGLSYTKDMALSALKGGIAVGVKLMVIYLVAAVALRMSPLWGALIGSISLTNPRPFWVVGTSAALLAYLSMQIPKLASDLLNGTASLTAGDAASNMMMGMAALATAGAGAVGASQAMKHAGASAAETLGGLVQAGAAGLNSAGDLGKSGLDAVGHAAKEVASHGGSIVGGGVRNMLDTASSGLKAGMDKSIGGQVASSIEAARGGSISPASSSGSTTGTPSGGSPSGSGTASGNANTGGGSSSSGNTNTASGGASPGGGTSPGNTGSLGDASSASLTSGASGGKPGSGDPLVDRLDKLTAAMENQNGNQPSTASKIRDLAGYVPNDQASVGVSANLGHHGGEE